MEEFVQGPWLERRTSMVGTALNSFEDQSSFRGLDPVGLTGKAEFPTCKSSPRVLDPLLVRAPVFRPLDPYTQ